MEFDFSNFQVWMSMEKRKERMEKHVCFQTVAPILLSKISNSEFLKINRSYKQSVFHGV